MRARAIRPREAAARATASRRACTSRRRPPTSCARSRRGARDRAVREQPAVDPGRRRRGARRRVRHRDLRGARAKTHGRYYEHIDRGARGPADDHDGRRRRSRFDPARAAAAICSPEVVGRHRGDDDRRDPPARSMAARGGLRYPIVAVNDAVTKQLLRQPLRHRAVDDRRDRARHEHAPRGHADRGRRLRLGRQGDRDARARPGSAGHRLRDRAGRRARGLHGRVPRPPDGEAPRRKAGCSSP